MRYFALIATVAVVSVVVGLAKDKRQDLAATVNLAHQGIAAVVVPGQLGMGLSIGTAFFVSDEYLLTAAHVVRSAPITGLHIPTFVTNTTRIGGLDPLEYEVTEISDDSDVALLRIKTKPRRKVLPFALAVGTLPPGTDIAVTGYGSLADFPLTFTGVVASQGSMSFGTALMQVQRQPSFGRASSIFVVDRPLPGGFSGSPVYVRTTGVAYGIAVEVKPDLNSGALGAFLFKLGENRCEG